MKENQERDARAGQTLLPASSKIKFEVRRVVENKNEKKKKRTTLSLLERFCYLP